MPYRLGAFADVGLDEASLKLVLDEHRRATRPRLQKLWTYYRNPLRPVGVGAPGRWYRQAQEVGLPGRITGCPARLPGGVLADDRAPIREAVIENDIAWRVHTMVDFMFGKPLTILSTARDERLRRLVERVLDRLWERSGGIALLQDMALLGHVYGHVDLLVRVGELPTVPAPVVVPENGEIPDALLRALDAVRIEIIEPSRGVALLDPRDYRRLRAYVIEHDEGASAVSLWERVRDGARAGRLGPRSFEVLSARAWQVYEQGELAWEQATGGEVPVFHIQNVAQPFEYSGLGEVEPLVPLQDELNTRLSDRACRVTMQSFKMYLAKGVDGFEKSPIGPGQVWSTDNMDAQISEFGGDASAPSEEAHVQEVREAMDKVSGVPPLAGGVVRAKIGNLSSANALKITLMALLGKTARKRVTYGRGIAQVCAYVLKRLDGAGLLAIGEIDRDVRLEWADPIPEDPVQQALAAEAKARLGVPHERLVAELGYAPGDPGVM